MQRTLASPPVGSPEMGANSSFNVVTAYEDFTTGKHARETYDFLVQNLGPNCQFSNQMWKFDVLSIPKLAELAAKDAATGDIILIATHGTSELPGQVKRWFELWLAEEAKPMALVALLDCPQEEIWKTRGTREYLAGIARRGGMEFFAQVEAQMAPQSGGQPLLAQRPANLSEKTLTTLAGAVQREVTVPRWGINE
jgi:hypothetical protein